MTKNTLSLVCLILSACTNLPDGDSPHSCEEIYSSDTFELGVGLNGPGPQACKLAGDTVPHGAQPFTPNDYLKPVPPGLPGGDFYAGPTRYYTDLAGINKVGVLVHTPDGNCAWVSCDGGIPTTPTDAGVD